MCSLDVYFSLRSRSRDRDRERGLRGEVVRGSRGKEKSNPDLPAQKKDEKESRITDE